MPDSTPVFADGQPGGQPEPITIAALDVIIHAAEQSFTENQLMYLADAFAEIARRKRSERESS